VLLRFEQVYEPVANSLVLSMLVALIPIVVLFVMLAVFSVPAQWSSLASLAAAFVIAVAVYDMPLALALNSTLYGVAFGLFLIVWIVVKAMITLRLNPLQEAPHPPIRDCGGSARR
jgi:lactate permease